MDKWKGREAWIVLESSRGLWFLIQGSVAVITLPSGKWRAGLMPTPSKLERKQWHWRPCPLLTLDRLPLGTSQVDNYF